LDSSLVLPLAVAEIPARRNPDTPACSTTYPDQWHPEIPAAVDSCPQRCAPVCSTTRTVAGIPARMNDLPLTLALASARLHILPFTLAYPPTRLQLVLRTLFAIMAHLMHHV
jgi:hypothetical protein